jgi:hypothetical protein
MGREQLNQVFQLVQLIVVKQLRYMRADKAARLGGQHVANKDVLAPPFLPKRAGGFSL